MIDALNEWISLIGSLIGGALRYAPGIAAALAPGILLLSVLLIAARVFIVLPLRRRERAHAFLDLLEMSLKQGRSPENMIVEVAATGDKTLGKDFRQLATQIQEGASLGRGLTQTPGFLPVPIAAMLQAGEEMRDVRKVLPPCREALASGPSRAMGAFNYLPVFSPGLPMLAIAQFLAIVVLPKFQEIWRDLLIEKRSLPFATQLFLALARYAVPMNLLLLTVILVLFSLMFERGRRFWAAGYSRLLKPLGDRCLFRLPWRRKRMQRDFSAMLAILLDAGMPEADAVNLAAHSTGNGVFLQRAWEVVERLQQGERLTEAIRALDDTGEFQWRLTNAAHAGTGFLRALQGWHDALEAKAFQQEQAASQAISTVFIVLNGALACLIALAMFQPMVQIIQEGTMW